MGKTLYLETSSGISGDMFVAAMIDLGADPEALERALNSIPADGFMVEISSVKKSGIACCDFNVILDAAHENHDHDMAYLYGPAPVSSAAPQEEAHHCHGCEDEEAHHCHCHEEEPHHHHEHHHHGRHLAEILDIIDATDMTDSAKALAGKMFHIVAEAESLAHHMPLEEVHFHEVGAIDSIVDIIAAAVTFDSLGITDVIIPCLTEGRGTVRCQHGVLPVPVPATMNIIEAYDMPLTIMEAKGEYVTPTGAAIAAAICTTHQLPKAFRIVRTGLGAGKRDYTERTNILRAYLIEGNAMEEGKDEIVKLETDIDDSTGEALGYTIDRLMQAGALDVHYSPVYMKKNRPAWELTVICKKSRMEELEDIIFKETTTIGIREFPSVMRSILRRNQKQVETPFGIAEVKEVALPGERRFYPEYESVKAIAEKEHLPFAEVYHLVKALAEQNE
ncbi:MAG: nickel pincer cofactor biosynthesis protein LarC [Dialister sp.]|nr:nickel pincer cofactor biosynthesis protein LarC [Dialister sp.]MDY5062165.1 nickel pincer cofactor biosynthesis protein LarC [Dialister sp.]